MPAGMLIRTWAPSPIPPSSTTVTVRASASPVKVGVTILASSHFPGVPLQPSDAAIEALASTASTPVPLGKVMMMVSVITSSLPGWKRMVYSASTSLISASSSVGKVTVGGLRALTGAAVKSRLVSRAKVNPTPSIFENLRFMYFLLILYSYVSINKGIKPRVPSFYGDQVSIESVFEFLITLSLSGSCHRHHLLIFNITSIIYYNTTCQ